MENNQHDLATRQAAQWYARLGAPDCHDLDRKAFERWLKSDPANPIAYELAKRAARLVSQNLMEDERFKALADKAIQPSAATTVTGQSEEKGRGFFHASNQFFQRQMRYAAAVVFALGVVLIATHSDMSGFRDGYKEYYVNNEKLQQEFELSDGSTLFLDVGASVSVLITDKERRLELNKGRAYFEVAHDKSRPFSVAAADTTVVALGTRFQVDIEPHQEVSVVLAEGSVLVTNDVNESNLHEVLSPGEQLQLDIRSGRHSKKNVDATALTSWSSGILVFDGMPLAQVLDEINRYATTKVYLGDGSLADVPIGGSFVAGGDSREFVKTLTAVLPLRTVSTGANEIALFYLYEPQGG